MTHLSQLADIANAENTQQTALSVRAITKRGSHVSASRPNMKRIITLEGNVGRHASIKKRLKKRKTWENAAKTVISLKKHKCESVLIAVVLVAITRSTYRVMVINDTAEAED